jgi:aminopeptidase N
MRGKITLLLACFLLQYAAVWAGNGFCHFQSDVRGAAQALNTAGHQSLEAQYDVKFHHLSLNVERTSTYISGSVRTVATVVAPSLDSFAFELHPNLIIDSVVYFQQLLPVVTNLGERIAVLPVAMAQGGTLDLTIYYHGTPPGSGSAAIGAGFSCAASQTWGNRATWSLSQPFSAYEWWPCKQALGDKIDSTWFYITTDASNKAGSNGVLVSVANIGNGKALYKWKSRTPIDYYLVSVAVAQYVEYKNYAHPQGYADSILIQNYIYNNAQTLPSVKAELDKIPAMIELFSKLFGLYPFAKEKYGHCMAPISGGMEHQTMTSLGFFDFEVDAHELLHQWFGDNVTCATWKDIFVNEGFASYGEYLADYYLKTPAVATQKMLDVHNSVMGQAGGAVWFTDSTNVTRIFDSRLTYDKGSAIIHSMRYLVNNDSLFFLALRNYQQQHKDNVATAQDLKDVLESTTGVDFTQFYAQWFYGEGYPKFKVKWNQVNNALKLKVTETTSTSVTPLFITPVDYKIRRTALPDTIVRLTISQNLQYYSLPLTGTVTNIFVDPDNWILNKMDSVAKDASLDEYTSVEDLSNTFSVYPNPVKDVLMIDANAVNLSAEIYAMDGRMVANHAHLNGNAIAVADLVPGVYMVRVSQKGEAIGRKVFIKE